MNTGNVAIVLSGVVNHRILLEKLKARGYYTILADYLDNPPAKRIADEHVQISTLDIEAIEKLAEKRKASLLINCCSDQVNVGIMRIAEKLNLPHPYSYETALKIANKDQMKKIMVEGGILTTPFCCITSPDEVAGIELKYPLYVKPADGYGSNGVTCVYTREEAGEAVIKALQAGRNGKVILEEEAKGVEHNVYCFPQNKKANVLMVARKYTDNNSEDKVVKSIGTLSPAPLTDTAKKRIAETADKIVELFDLENCPMFMQVMINGDDINVIEFSARMAGGISCRTIKMNTGFDLFDATINGFLRIPNDINFTECKQIISVSIVYANPCIFDHISGVEELLEAGILKDISLPREPGTKIMQGSANSSRVAFLIHQSEDIDDLMEKIRVTFETIKVLDVAGKDQLKRELHLSKELL